MPFTGVNDYLDRVRLLVRDVSGFVPDDQRLAHIDAAIRQYSQDRPRLLVSDLIGDGTTRRFSVPAEWVRGFSRIIRFETPINQIPPRFIDLQDNIQVIDDANELPEILTLTFTLAASGDDQTGRFSFTTVHQVDSQTNTVPSIDEDAVAKLAAGNICESLALIFAESRSPTIDADAVDYDDKGDLYVRLRDRFFRDYKEHIQSDEVASFDLQTLDLDNEFQWGRRFFFRDPRWRNR